MINGERNCLASREKVHSLLLGLEVWVSMNHHPGQTKTCTNTLKQPPILLEWHTFVAHGCNLGTIPPTVVKQAKLCWKNLFFMHQCY
mmetsp:Transcript_2258/g.4133  ORF Transcript_2258/g.4133 Transcript_2258/m.4133 type:complete len:87 (-) Transcript_2258:1559-1819(-)